MIFFRVLYVTFLIGWIGFLLGEGARAEGQESWGTLGYTQNPPAVEVVPAEEPKQVTSLATTQSSAEVPEPDYHRSATASPTEISTVQNTFGVETEENVPVKLYAAPFAGISSAFGNNTTNITPSYAAGVNAGFLLSSSFMIELGYMYDEQNASGPTNAAALGTSSAASDLFKLKQNAFDAGAKLFFLGRESRIRPFFGAGGSYVRSTLNYNSNYLGSAASNSLFTNDFNVNQMNAYGEIGAEVAITKSIVVTALFKVRGVLTSNTSGQDATTAQQDYTSDRVIVGNSLSQSATYTAALGVGIYF